MVDNFQTILEQLNKEQSEKNWDKFAKELPKSKAKQYRVVYQKGNIAKSDDLLDSYAELFDSKDKMLGKVPIFLREGKKVRGATIYLKRLSNLNKPM